MNVSPGCSPGWQAMPTDRPCPDATTSRQQSAQQPQERGGKSLSAASPGEAARAEALRSRLATQGPQPRDVNTMLLEAVQTALESGMLDLGRSYTLRRLVNQLDRIRMRDLPRDTEKALSLLRKVVTEEFAQMALRTQAFGVGKGSEELASEEEALLNRELELRRQWNELPWQDPKAVPEPGEAIGPLVDQLSALTTFWNKWLAPRNG